MGLRKLSTATPLTDANCLCGWVSGSGAGTGARFGVNKAVEKVIGAVRSTKEFGAESFSRAMNLLGRVAVNQRGIRRQQKHAWSQNFPIRRRIMQSK
jgi:hypothetical protein